MEKINIFWFRRDLRLNDNIGLYHALQSEFPVLPIFIFDENIINELPKDDARVNFIHKTLLFLDAELKKTGSSLLMLKGNPLEIFEKLTHEYLIQTVFTNRDYEPYATARDTEIETFLKEKNISFRTYKDQVIFEKDEIVKDDGKPYTIFTPYKRKWLKIYLLQSQHLILKINNSHFYQTTFKPLSLQEIGFVHSETKVKPYSLKTLSQYAETRDFPALDNTSYLSVHLRFGTIGIRELIEKTKNTSDVFLSELIWREFFMQILYHYPQVINSSFYKRFNGIKWRNNEQEFQKWCDGKTGYPLVDAGMRELNQTGYMHNRVRMVVASFLTKHLLIDWRWGEAYFAKKLLDYDLAANNGNWQWAAGTGCDAAPYFRVFNPSEQLKKFDKDLKYVKKWIPEFNTPDYPSPMVEHSFARKRALETYGAIKNL